MILSHIKLNANLKTEDGEYFSDLFQTSKETMRPETIFKKQENKKEIVFRFTESVYLELDSNYEEKPEKAIEKSQILPKTSSNSENLHSMAKNFLETFKTKEQIYWALEILGNVFLFVGEENPKNAANPQSSFSNIEKIYEKGLDIYKVILLLIQKLGHGDKPTHLKLNQSIFVSKFVLLDEDKQKLFRLVISHLSLAFEKIENLKKADFLIKVIEVFNKKIISNPLMIKDETWEFILRVLLGILDYIIQKNKKIEPKVSEELQHQMIMLLINAWINSGMRDCNLWKIFTNYAITWQNVDSFLQKWKEVCLDLTRKVLRDIYHLPFAKVKVEINPQKDLKTTSFVEPSYKKDYETKASTFLLIVYDKLKKHISSDNYENSQTLFWANIPTEQTVFLWHKFLHLFEKHPCENSNNPLSQLPTTKFSLLLLKTIQKIVDEILKVGHGYSNKSINEKAKPENKYYVSYKEIETIWGKAIYPRRIDKTRCEECDKKFSKNIYFEEETIFNKKSSLDNNPQKYSNSDNEKMLDREDLLVKHKISSEFFDTFNLSALSPNPKKETPSKKELFERDLQKMSLNRQNSFKKQKSFKKDSYLQARIHDNNKYLFCKHKVAKGDDILAVFSKWLFECGSIYQSGYEELNLLSIQILAKIFIKSRGPFKEEYLLKFYCLLLENLKKEESSGYLKICVRLFEGNLPHTYYLIKEFILNFSVDKSFKNTPTKFLDIYNKYISRFACSYLGRLKYIEEFESKLNKSQYYSLDFWINHVLECLKIWEKKEKTICLKTINWVLCIHSMNKSRFNSVINKIFKSCKDNHNKFIKAIFSLKMMKLCFKIMVTAGELYHLKRSSAEEGLNKDELKDIKLSFDFFFDELDIFLKKYDIKSRLSKIEATVPTKDKEAEKERERENEVILKISFLVIQCIYIWLTLPMVEISENLYNSSISYFLEVFQNTSYKKLNEYSSLILKNLMNNMGKSIHFQKTILLNTAISSIEDDSKNQSNNANRSTNKQNTIFESFKESQSVVINQDVILTIYLGDHSPNEDIVLYIRNSQGKFLWQGELIYKLFPNKNYEPFTDIEAFPFKTNAEIYENLRYYWKNEQENEQRDDEPFESNIKSEQFFDPKGMTLDEMIEMQFKMEEEYEVKVEKNQQVKKQKSKKNQNYFTQKLIEINSLPETRLINITKLFLFHFGLLDIRNSAESFHKTIFLENSKELWDSLAELDKISERSQLEVNCFYIDSLYQSDTSLIITDEANFKEYTEFIESISCSLDETSFKTGMYESVKNYQRKYSNLNYSSNMLFEIVYLQPQIMEKPAKNPNIIILWSARTNDKSDNKLPLFLKHFLDEKIKHFILITPLNFYLFSIKVFKITEINEIKDIFAGPLISKMIITKDTLPLLVNATILNIYRKQNLTPLYEAQEQRKMKIEKIIEKFTNKEKTDSFLSILNFPSIISQTNNDKQSNVTLKKNLSHSKTTPIDAPIFSNEKQKKTDKITKNDQFEIIVGEEDINVEEFNSNSSRK